VRGLARPGRDASALAAAGAEVATGDLLDDASLRRATRGMEGLVHCAARRGNWSREVAEQRAVNVEGTARLYRAAHDHGLARIVHVSTVGTLGANRDGKLLDESCRCNIRHLDLPYVESKLEAEERALSAAWAGMPVVVVNPGHLAGPRLDGRASSAVAKLAAGRMRWVPSGGITVGDVEDVAQTTITALERGRVGERYVLGGHNLELVAFYAALARAMGVRPPRIVVPRIAARVLALGAGVVDAVGLSRPPWAPEVFRSWGWYLYADCGKAVRELDHRIRPLEEIARRTAVRA
jgi:dihydroflavonol-4-reductase